MGKVTICQTGMGDLASLLESSSDRYRAELRAQSAKIGIDFPVNCAATRDFRARSGFPETGSRSKAEQQQQYRWYRPPHAIAQKKQRIAGRTMGGD
jgi:hypothetical protein